MKEIEDRIIYLTELKSFCIEKHGAELKDLFTRLGNPGRRFWPNEADCILLLDNAVRKVITDHPMLLKWIVENIPSFRAWSLTTSLKP